ncbi:MAG: hypothetical protein A3K19_32300 [Lentisphaerae bacterium RIFOXYB12_FULL_65_16]|nr:MAG: hypothetical protein A3K18_12670 [Lentisphaerae bacterium RIFOXYA12_64_32]OGV85693.1 MAG: hypothetical protein A3K19_32300 [Lentisphaerae bacterium RIFOXYB12_FULL_65_16]
MSATIRDVARRARVSETTVSLAFQDKSRISDATRQRVLTVARNLNYVPNLAARHLRAGQSRTLGVLVNDLTNPFYTRMVRMVEHTAESFGYQVFVMESQWDPGREAESLRRMLEARVRGAILCLCEESDASFDILGDYNVPYVAMDSYPRGFKGPFVANDVTCAGRLAAEHLVAAGCRHLALLIPPSKGRRFSAFERLMDGFGPALKAHGRPFSRAQVVDADLSIAGGMTGFASLRSSRPKTDGLLCGNDLCALGVMEAADRAGVRVGPDLAVMGIDDLEVAALARVSLTTIRQPNDRVAELATQALVRAIDANEPVSIQTALEPELVIRNSTRLKGTP